MKKRFTFYLSAICIFLILLCGCSSLKIDDNSIGSVKFIYGDAHIEKELSKEDAKTITEMFDGKTLKSDNPSCGFTENVSVTIDGKCFWIACDQCGCVYFEQSLKYFNLNNEENEKLRGILETYGFTFPCI